jgi:hypothetical protein
METYGKYKAFFLIVSLAGTLFSGYLGAVKLFSKTCAFGEACPLFLGLPACYFGFMLFFLLLVFSVRISLGAWNIRSLAKSLLVVSSVGVVFAGYFSLEEIPLLAHSGFSAYVFGLPTCMLGSIFFLAILIASVAFAKKLKQGVA